MKIKNYSIYKCYGRFNSPHSSLSGAGVVPGADAVVEVVPHVLSEQNGGLLSE